MLPRMLYAPLVALIVITGLPAMRAVAAEQGNEVDRAFLDLTSVHHRDGIQMARLAETKATRDEVKAFAQKTRAGQEKDLAEIGATREKLFKGQPEADRLRMPEHTMDRQTMQAESQQMMARLEKAEGAAFDHEFVMAMTKHHRDAVQMAKSVASSAGDEKVRDLAKRMEAEQTQELAQLAKLDHGRTGSGGHTDTHQASPRTP